MTARGHDELFGAALAHWRFGAKREPDRAKVRVYNPNLEEHGWKSDHTVIEMINDDMPFLVDSVAAELSRRDIPIHLIVHPIIPVCRKDGAIDSILEPGRSGKGFTDESFMHMEVSRSRRPSCRRSPAPSSGSWTASGPRSPTGKPCAA